MIPTVAIASFLATLGAFGKPDAAPCQDPPAVTLTRAPERGLQPQVATGPDGALCLLYFKGEPAGGDLFYVKRDPASPGWSAPLRVNSEPRTAVALGTIRGGQIALGRDGRVHVAWNGANPSQKAGVPLAPKGDGATKPAHPPGAPMLYTRLAADGKSFEAQRDLMTSTFNLDGGGALGADSRGNVYVAWHGADAAGADKGEAGRRVWLTRSSDDGATFLPEAAVSPAGTGACGCCGMSGAADSAGRLFLLYRTATGGQQRDMLLLASNDGGATFTPTTVNRWQLAACPMTSAAITGASDLTVVAWETKGQVFLARVQAGATVLRPAGAPGDASTRKHPRVAVNSRGEVLLVWTEDTGWNHGGSIAWQVFDPHDHPIAGTNGRAAGLSAWSFAAAVARPDGSFEILY